MKDFNNYSYYLQRANAARELAQRATHPYIASIHREMASHYENTAAQIGQRMATSSDAQFA